MSDQQAAPARRSRKWPWIVGGLVAVVIVGTALSNQGNTPTAPGVPAGNDSGVQQEASSERVVVYSVTGTGIASNITYTTDGMTTMNQEADVHLPWTKEIRLPAGEAFQMVQISAQAGADTSEIHVTITVDGTLIKEAHATGGYNIASANESIGSIG